MPLYEYRCTRCGQTIEVLQKVNDPPRKRCSDCSGKLEKLVSRTSFQLKGGGWYAQGYGKSTGGKSSTNGGSSSKAGSSSSTKSSSSSTKSSSDAGDSAGGSKATAATA
jgi:putative FmdB family regulatory protein